MSNASAKRPRADAPTVVLHWLVFVTLLLSLVTGLRISADSEDAVLARALSPVLMQGDVHGLHLVSATALVFAAVAYVVYLWRAVLGSRVALGAAGLRSRDRDTRWASVNRILYWIAFALIIVAGVTGALLYFAPQLISSAAVLTVHLAAAWGIIAYVAVHVAAQAVIGGMHQLLKIFSPRVAYTGAGAIAMGVSLAAVAAILSSNGHVTIQPLKLAATEQSPLIDGDPGDAVWANAKPVSIHTTQGANVPGGEVSVRVRGVHDSDNAYLLFEWPDATRSQKHLPLVKTDEGWKVMESKYGIQDEDGYYEDKFGVMLARTSKIGGGATHMGPKPLDDKPGSPNKRGLHYTTDGGIVDVWHWKSVRTRVLGQIDDNYFGPPMPAPNDTRARYTGGYTQDPDSGGGFDQNWTTIAGSKFVQPKRLPRDFAALQARMGNIALDPKAGDDGQWWLSLAETVPYAKQLDTYPVGTVIPSVLIDKPFEGDRGDITAKASWKDGWWRLEVVRRLDTHSKYDVPIANGTHLWVAVFDHTQTRHTRHLHPVRIHLD